MTEMTYESTSGQPQEDMKKTYVALAVAAVLVLMLVVGFLFGRVTLEEPLVDTYGEARTQSWYAYDDEERQSRVEGWEECIHANENRDTIHRGQVCGLNPELWTGNTLTLNNPPETHYETTTETTTELITETSVTAVPSR